MILSGYDWPDNRTKQVAFINSAVTTIEGHVLELYTGVPVGWQAADLTVRTGAPLVNQQQLSDLDLLGYQWQAGGTKQVVFMDSVNSHLQELSVGVGGQWQLADLTVLTGVTLG